MNKIISLLVFVVSSFILSAQPNYDSLLQIWNDATKHDTVRLNAINDMLFKEGYLYSSQGTGLMFAELQYEFAKSKNLKKHMFYALRNQGLSYNLKVMNKEALEFDLERLQIAQEISFDQGLAECYLSMGGNYSNLGDYPNALSSFLKSLDFYRAQNDIFELAMLLEQIGIVYNNLGNLLEAYDYFHQSLVAYEKVPNAYGVGRISVRIGELYELQGNYSDALEYFNQNLQMQQELWEEVKSTDGEDLSSSLSSKLLIGEALFKIGKVYMQQEENEKSISYLLEGLSIYEEVKNDPSIFYGQIDVGNAYLQKGDLEEAMMYYNRSLELAESISYPHYLSAVLPFIGDVYLEQADYGKAIETYLRSVKIAEQMSTKGQLTQLYQKIGTAYGDQGDFNAAAEWCKKALEFAEKTGSIPDQVFSCGCLSAAYEELGDYKMALSYFQQLILLDDSIPSEETNKKLMQMEFDKKRLSDSLLMVEDKLNTEMTYQASLSSERNTRNIFMLVGLGILLAAIASFLRMQYVRRTNKELAIKNALIAKEKERAEASEKSKEQFFNNISHEFRTPLTLIMGPLDEVLEGDINENSRPNLKIMQRSVSRLQGMINELLDLSKMEYGKIKLKAGEHNIVELTQQFLQSFESLADQKKIKLGFKSQADEYKVWVDAEQIRKVLANLLWNAFKFTDEGGRVFVEVSESQQSAVGSQQSGETNNTTEDWRLKTTNGVIIKVTDTGNGIPPDQLPHIFDRFYQVAEEDQTHAGGSGIGLALTKELVELHHGTITVESHPGKGTSFIVFIPFGKELYGEDEIVSGEDTVTKSSEPANEWAIQEEISGHVSEDEITKKNEKPILLLVEDNQDMMEYISSHLEKKYKLLKAKDGEQGLTTALEQLPDLIISDVMMPRMDGIAMTDRLKTDQRTSHIPVIMLTARASVDSKIEGLETGADDYVTKPFNARELQTRVKNLIEQRTKLREHFANELNKGITITKENQLPSMDQKFIQRAVEVVNEHLSENEYDVNQFSAEMALSRSQLHRKIKALTNKSATEFIRTIRLNKAAELLKKKTDNITQIAYETGFNNLSWFAKGFKEQFGISPSEYMKADD